MRNQVSAQGTISFDDVGAGLPVVLLHAFPLARTMWAPQVDLTEALLTEANHFADAIARSASTTTDGEAGGTVFNRCHHLRFCRPLPPTLRDLPGACPWRSLFAL